MPYGTGGVDYIFRRQRESGGDDGGSRGDAADGFAGAFELLRARRREYRAAYPAARAQRRISRVDDRIGLYLGNISVDYFKIQIAAPFTGDATILTEIPPPGPSSHRQDAR